MPPTTKPGLVRMQGLLTSSQRQRLVSSSRLEDRALSAIVREAVDFSMGSPVIADTELASTFGSLPDLKAPARHEWDRG